MQLACNAVLVALASDDNVLRLNLRRSVPRSHAARPTFPCPPAPPR